MRRRAFALLEVAVASAIGLVALTILVGALLPLMRATRRSTGQGELMQVAHLTRLRLSEDLQSSGPAGLRFASSEYFSIQSVEQASDSGHPVYSPKLLIYRVQLAQGSLTRLLGEPTDQKLDQPSLYTPSQLQELFSTLPGQRKTLLYQRLKQFQLAPIEPHRPQLLRLRFQLENGSLQYQCNEVIALRNGDS